MKQLAQEVLIVISVIACSCRFKDMNADHGGVAKELERANEEFKEFERKDIKYREDLKHVKAKLKKLQEKLTKDSAKMEVGLLLNLLQPPLLVHLLLVLALMLTFLLLAMPWHASTTVDAVAATQSSNTIPAALEYAAVKGASKVQLLSELKQAFHFQAVYMPPACALKQVAKSDSKQTDSWLS